MIQASRLPSAAPFHSAPVHRPAAAAFGRRACAAPLAAPETPRWPIGRDDLRYFLTCYAAGLAFFLIILS